MLCAGLFSCKKESEENVAPTPDPIVNVPASPSTEIVKAYLLVVTANADTTRSDTVSVSE